MGLDMFLKDKHNNTEVAYWRKANAIHNWFVENVQYGVDDCCSYPVTRDQLEALLTDVSDVLENKNKAPEILPTKGGFFFGNTEYDKWYWLDMEYTKSTIEKALRDYPDSVFYYHSSW